MNKKNKLMTAAGVGLGAIALIAASAGVAQAVSSTDRPEGQRGGSHSSLVADGTLTKAQSQAIRDAIHASQESEREANMASALKELVTAGTITQAQADAITANDASNIESMSHKRGGHLRELVAAGTITQAQADSVHEALHASKPTAAEREAQLTSVLADLVAKNTITQAQADAVKAHKTALGEAQGKGFGKGGHGHGHKGGHGAGRSATGTRV